MKLQLLFLIISDTYAEVYTCDDGTEIESGNSYKLGLKRTSVFGDYQLGQLGQLNLNQNISCYISFQSI